MLRLQVIAVLVLGVVYELTGCGSAPEVGAEFVPPPELRPEHFGVALPYPIAAEFPDIDEQIYRSIMPHEAERIVPLVMRIDTLGTVTKVTPERPNDSVVIAKYRAFLTGYRFEPGLIDGLPATTELLVELQTNHFAPRPVVRFPVDSARSVVRHELYWRALRVYGIEAPEIISFPSYHYRFDPTTQWRDYPVKLFRLDLDTLGLTQGVELIFETEARFGDQIRNAVKWGEYRPLRLNGKATATSCFLVICLYPTLKYPTAPTTIDPEAAGLWDRTRVLIIPDTAGLILPPVPKREWSGEISEEFFQGLTPELVTGRVMIQANGRSRVSEVSTDFYRTSHYISQRSSTTLFFPAKRLDGSTSTWEGLAYLRYLDESHVRIWFDWLGGTDPGPPVQADETQ